MPDDVTIAEKQAELLKWLEQLTLIARKIKSLRLEEPSGYKRKLLEEIDDILPGKTAKWVKGMPVNGKAITKLSQRKSVAVVRLRVQQQLDSFLKNIELAKGDNSTAKSLA